MHRPVKVDLEKVKATRRNLTAPRVFRMAVPARVVMYFMFFFTSTLHFLTREMAPMLIPMICDAYGYSLAQRGCERYQRASSLRAGPRTRVPPRAPAVREPPAVLIF
jgi:hypothetical protein